MKNIIIVFHILVIYIILFIYFFIILKYIKIYFYNIKIIVKSLSLLIVSFKYILAVFVITLNYFIIIQFGWNMVAFKDIYKNLKYIYKNYSYIMSFYFDKKNYILKKYFYTINHKRLGINYLYFTFLTGFSGALLATMIRLEMAIPGSPVFKGDSVRYLQVMTAHGLIMIFFVLVPIFFGGFANYFIPYHLGTKDVAFPRLNSIGFWIQPCGFLLIAKIGFLRPQYWKYSDKVSNYFNIKNKSKFLSINDNYIPLSSIIKLDKNQFFIKYNKLNYKLNYYNLKNLKFNNKNINNNYLHNSNKFIDVYYLPVKLINWFYINYSSSNFWYLASQITKLKRKKSYVTKCSNASMTVSGWTFITPFSSNIKFTAIGAQDMLIVGVIFAGISTTISLTNLLVTRRTLVIPGLKNRRVLIPFLTISILLMLRTLAIITPILGSAMLMLLLDRHWNTSFFDFSYGGDPILFQHLFWFFGHPEVYVLIIPAFGIINQVISNLNLRRMASKHHMIWAVYIMTYMGFFVWGHHMYLIGLDHRSRSLYSTITIMISLPATIKLANWTLTLFNGASILNLITVSIYSFICFFIVAGFTGMWLSHVSLNISMHDTFYVVAHFHIMLSGAAMMSIFIGFYFYFNQIFGIKYSKTLSWFHIYYYTGGQWMTFLPMFWLGFSGMPRRVHDYPATFMGWHSMATTGHFVTLFSLQFFYFLIFESHKTKKVGTLLNFAIPRWNKRLLYYLYTIIYKEESRVLFKFLPISKIRKFILNKMKFIIY